MATLSYNPLSKPKYGCEEITCPHCWVVNIWYFSGPTTGFQAPCRNCQQTMTIWPPRGWEAETEGPKLFLPG